MARDDMAAVSFPSPASSSSSCIRWARRITTTGTTAEAKSSAFPHQCHHYPLDDQFSGRNQFGVLGVLRLQVRLAALSQKSLQGAFVVDQCRNRISWARGQPVFEYRDIAVDDMLADHRITTHPESKGSGCRADAQCLNIYGDATLRLLLLLLG